MALEKVNIVSKSAVKNRKNRITVETKKKKGK